LNGAICGSIKSKMAADGHLGYTKMATTVLPINIMFASRDRFSGSANLMVPLSMTSSDPEARTPVYGHGIV